MSPMVTWGISRLSLKGRQEYLSFSSLWEVNVTGLPLIDYKRR